MSDWCWRPSLPSELWTGDPTVPVNTLGEGGPLTASLRGWDHESLVTLGVAHKYGTTLEANLVTGRQKAGFTPLQSYYVM